METSQQDLRHAVIGKDFVILTICFGYFIFIHIVLATAPYN